MVVKKIQFALRREYYYNCEYIFVSEIDNVKRPLYSKHPLSKFAWTAMEDIDTVCGPF